MRSTEVFWRFRQALRSLIVVVLLSGSAFALPGCGGDDETSDATPASTDPAQGWTEEDLTFAVDGTELRGLLTLPISAGPHLAVVIVTGSEDESGGFQSGVSNTYFVDLARQLADVGFAAFRYDTRGVGQSGGIPSIAGLETRRDEAVAALHAVRGHPEISSDDVGLWGISQEGWVISMAAADNPTDIAFIVVVSGAGISVAEQQVWGIETQSRAAGLDPDDVERATLFGRLLVDWQLTDPLFHDANQETVERLGPGPWQGFHTLVYDSDTLAPSDDLDRVIEILASVQDEPWAQSLHLEELYLPTLRSIPADQIELVQAVAEQSLLIDPVAHLTRVTSPVLAVFGEDDIIQPSDRSAELFARYLDEAGNDDVTIVILPDAGHDISATNSEYWGHLTRWLGER